MTSYTTDSLKNLRLNKRFIQKFSSNLEEFSQYFEIPNIDRLRYKKMADEFLEYSCKDLESAIILYKNDAYPHSIYHLQQAVEKLVKAYMMFYFNLTDKDVKKIVGHNTPKAFCWLLQKFNKNILSFLDACDQFNIGNKDTINQLVQLIKRNDCKLNSENIRIARMSETDILRLIDASKSYSQKIREFNTDSIKSNVDFIVNNYIESDPNLQNKKDILSKAKKIESHIFTIIENPNGNYYSHIPALYFISIVTFPHAEIPRYPNEMRISEYNEKLGIVICFEELALMTKNIIEDMKNVQISLS